MTYQDLSGGSGRRVYYRPQRYRTGAIFGATEPLIRIADIDARLIDVSIGGLACELGGEARKIRAGSIVPLQLWLLEERAFTAQVEVVRSEAETSRIGVRFIDSVPEPQSLRAMAQAQRARNSICEGAGVYDPVPPDYRSAIHEAATVLSHWKTFLDQREAELLGSDTRDTGSQLAQLEELAEKRLRVDWLRVHSRANDAAETLANESNVLGPSKALTELLVTPLLSPAPIWSRAYQKPRGYPGDFELMNYMYDESRAGSSTYARIMHQLGREERLASTVRNRRDLLVRTIRESITRAVSLGASEVRVCNIGAGPARELEDLLSVGDLPVPLKVWLVDQDEDALAFAYERLRRASFRFADRVQILCRFTSFRQMLSDTELLRELNGQDLIYSAGLFDYLSRNVAQILLRELATLLREHGCLFVGNAAAHKGIRWVPEFVLDWRLRYRSPEEMLDLARDLPVSASAEIRKDDSAAWHFLMVTRSKEVAGD